jgi:ABC-type nitrate/sulfonate/bicarbonate transport system ATPase subunit
MIEINGLNFAYGDQKVFDGLTMSIDGHTCITGPSGSGKSTLLRLIAGFNKPQSGTISDVPSPVSFLFQEDRLLPWSTACENVAAVLPKERRSDAPEWLDKVELGDKRDSYPDSMSGGQNRRIALARALAFGGRLLILDEPFKGLDIALTKRMISLIHSLNVPAIAAIHSQEEIALFGGSVIKLG